ncbi:MAG: hypothetical protein ACP5US_11925 [Candidatus Kryptoniota bacterium]
MSFELGDAAKLTPPFRLVAAYFITSVIFFVLGTFLTFVNFQDFQEFYFQPHILAVTHTLALGWITMIISGAVYQLIPVVFRIRIFSIYMAYIQYFLLTGGAIGMIYGFYEFNIGVGFIVFALMAYTAIVIFVFNVVMTLLNINEWNITGYHFFTSMIFLFTAVSIGLLLALNLRYGFLMVNHLEILKIHAHLAIAGFVMMVIFGSVYQLIPMFALSYDFSRLPGMIAYFLIVIGLVGYGTAITFGDNTGLAGIFSIITALGMFSFLYQVTVILKHRVRRKLDAGLKQTVISFIFLGLSSLMYVTSSLSNQLPGVTPYAAASATAFLIIFGFIGSIILGQMLKIGPFLVWLRKYSAKVGIADVPSLHEMVNQKLAYLQLFLWTLAVPVATIGILISSQQLLFAGTAVMFVSSVIFSIVQYKVFVRS